MKIQYWLWQMGGVVTISILFAIGVWAIHQERDKKQLAALSGYLLPGDEPTPPNICGGNGTAPKGVTMLFLGNQNDVIEVSTFPHTVLLINGRQALILDKSSDGRIAPIVDVRSPDGKIVVRMNKQEGFVANPNNVLKVNRPDTSTLIVEDQYGREVLNAKYLNRQAFKLTGIFTIPGYGSIPLGDVNLFNSCLEVGPNGQHFNNDIVINLSKPPQ